MYGKLFASTFTGSMYGAGPDVFAVWAYVIANTVDSQVELNPNLIAALLGCTPDRARAAIEVLCAPDPNSRSKAEGGRRLVREGEFAYRVPNFAAYRSIRNEEDRRAYNREKKREQRARDKVNASVIDSQRKSTVSAQAEAVSSKQRQTQKQDTPTDRGFAACWSVYPKRGGGNSRALALKAYLARVRAGAEPADLLAGTERYASFVRATGREGTEYVKQGATFFGPGEHWAEPWIAPTAVSTNGSRSPEKSTAELLAERGIV